MAGKGSETRQESETEQSREKDAREEHSMPIGKCIAKRGLGRRILWKKRRTDHIEARIEENTRIEVNWG